MARVEELLELVSDPALRAELLGEVATLKRRQQYGLVFERHMPESAVLLEAPIHVGSTVFKRHDETQIPYTVIDVKGEELIISIDDRSGKSNENRPTETIKRSDSLVRQGFNEAVYPGLIHAGRISRGGDKPYHSVIEGENFHVLQLLTFAMPGKFDAIYIDPPFNSGARDWKYNNDYVDGNDAYRHSKWLAFMERRLSLAKKLLRPDASVLIVAIDEKEYLRLGMLLEQMFPSAQIQMVSTVISPQGAARRNQFARTDEYLFFVSIGASSPAPCALSREWMGNIGSTVKGKLHWSGLRRTGTNAARSDRPNLFYPVYISSTSDKFVSVGDAVPLSADRKSIEVPEGCHAVWPIRSDGSEGNWQINPLALRTAIQRGFVRLGRPEGERTTISYLKSGEQKKVENATFEVTGHRSDGSLIVNDLETAPEFVPGTQWAIPSHDASRHGSNLLRELIPGRKFPFPKSLYAVEDALRFYVKDKPDALILDFFGGSGTTTHAVARLNHEDNGRRQVVLVTNNEVSEDEAKRLRGQGFAPGDAAWQAQGIFDSVTMPRVRAAFTGRNADDHPIEAEYRFVDPFPMADGLAENVEFFRLKYLDPVKVELGMSAEELLPIIWMSAGARGERLGVDLNASFSIAHDGPFAILMKPSGTKGLLEALAEREDVNCIFIFTDSEDAYAELAEQLPTRCRVLMLPRDYLRSLSMFGETRT
jgi:adenine-specific DNA-methyltransferase